MGTLPLSLTGVAANWSVPQTLIETSFAQGVLLGNPNTPKVLLMGPKTSSGSATADSQVYGPLTAERDVITYFGTGSSIHRQWKAFTMVCPTAPIYGLAVTESGGTQASATITFASAATAAGKVSLYLAGKYIEVAFASGDAYDTGIAEAVKNAINADTTLAVTASRLNGVVTVQYRIKGTNGNWFRIRGSITSGCTTTCTVSAAVLGSGATDESYTTALATILASEYKYIIPAINPTTTSDARFAALSAQLVTQALPTTGIRQQCIVCTAETIGNATTFVTAYNKPRNSVLWQKNSEWEPMEVAAHMAGVRYNLETGADPGVNYDGYGNGVNDIWFVPCQYSQADQPTRVEQNTAISVGLTPIAASTAGKSYVVMSCTAAGADPRIRDTAKVTVVDRFADDLAVRYSSQWQRAKLADDPTNDGAKPLLANICTPQRLKANTIVPLLLSYRDAGLLNNVDTATTGTIAKTATGIDPTVTTRINARIPLEVTPLCHQFAALVSEVSSG